MENSLELARNHILNPSGLDETHLAQAFSTLLDSSADSGEIYFQLRKHESGAGEDGIVKDASYNINQGVELINTGGSQIQWIKSGWWCTRFSNPVTQFI